MKGTFRYLIILLPFVPFVCFVASLYFLKPTASVLVNSQQQLELFVCSEEEVRLPVSARPSGR